MPGEPSEFAARLRDWRTKGSILQKNAADVLGVSIRTYQAWESSARTPNEIMQAELFRRMEKHESKGS